MKRQIFSEQYLFAIANRLEQKDADLAVTLPDPMSPQTDKYLNAAAKQLGFESYIDFVKRNGVLE